MKKKARTKGMALVLALMMLITSPVWIPSDEVKAASSNVYINAYSATVVTYKTGDGVSKNWSVRREGWLPFGAFAFRQRRDGSN